MKSIYTLLQIWNMNNKILSLDNGIYLCSPTKNTIKQIKKL